MFKLDAPCEHAQWLRPDDPFCLCCPDRPGKCCRIATDTGRCAGAGDDHCANQDRAKFDRAGAACGPSVAFDGTDALERKRRAKLHQMVKHGSGDGLQPDDDRPDRTRRDALPCEAGKKLPGHRFLFRFLCKGHEGRPGLRGSRFDPQSLGWGMRDRQVQDAGTREIAIGGSPAPFERKVQRRLATVGPKRIIKSGSSPISATFGLKDRARLGGAGAVLSFQHLQGLQVQGLQRHSPFAGVAAGVVSMVGFMGVLLGLPSGESVYSLRTMVRSQAV